VKFDSVLFDLLLLVYFAFCSEIFTI